MKHFTTSKLNFIAVPVPKGFGDDASINRRQDDFNQLYLQYNNSLVNGYESYTSINLPRNNNYEIIGFASQFTEDQAKQVVDEPNGIWYKYYTGEDFKIEYELTYSVLTSFHSLLEANDIWIKNPLGERPEHCLDVFGETLESERIHYHRSCDEWQAAEDKVSEYLILKVK